MAPDALSITVIRGDREAEYDALYVGDTLVRSEHAITAGHIAQATKGQAASVRVIEDDGGLLARWLTDYGIDPHYPASLTDALALMASGRVDMAVLSDIAAGGRVVDHGPETDAAMARLEGK